MEDYLNIRTLSVVTSIVSIAISINLLYIYFQRKTYPGFLNWTLAYISNSFGMILLGLRDYIPDLFSIIFANLLIGAYFIIILRGLRRFSGRKHQSWFDFSILLLTFLFFIVFTYIYPSINFRIIIISGMILLGSFSCCVVIWKQIPTVFTNHHQTFLSIGFLLSSLWHVMRILLTIFHEQEISNFMEAGTIQGLTFVVMIINLIIIGISLIITNAQRIEQTLQKVQEEIKTLTGMLPICSHCKKIRNDIGDWEQIEKYISHHSEAYFSHSLCPDCARTHYPEYFDE